MKLLAIQDFAAARNQTFDLTMGADTSMPLTLVEVKSLSPTLAPGTMRAPFSLMFRSQSAVVLPQKIYGLRNAVMGALQVFLVPVARDREGIVYQAVFN
ncbi:DUF6916 family protein [Brevundimonas vesicularis]|uniref:DUF6916 family protein n=1 Tax=Brevundimonas vesicularis TaxID=41276 RepID=UPI00384C0313